MSDVVFCWWRGRAHRGSPDPRHLSHSTPPTAGVNRSVSPARLRLLLLLPVFNNIINVWFIFLLNIGPEAGLASLPPRRTGTARSELRASFINLSWFVKLVDCTKSFHPPTGLVAGRNDGALEPVLDPEVRLGV